MLSFVLEKIDTIEQEIKSIREEVLRFRSSVTRAFPSVPVEPTIESPPSVEEKSKLKPCSFPAIKISNKNKNKKGYKRSTKMQLPTMLRHGAVCHNQELISAQPRAGRMFRAIIDKRGSGDQIVNFDGELVSLSEAAKRACNSTEMKRSSVDGYTFWKCAETGKTITKIRDDLVKTLMRA